MSGISNFARLQVKLAVFSKTGVIPATFFVALCKTVPTAASTGATIIEPNVTTEYVNYARQPITNDNTHWDTTTGGICTVQVTFPASGGGASSPVSIAAVALTDSVTYGAGNLWFFGQINQALSIGTGFAPTFLGNADLTFDLV